VRLLTEPAFDPSWSPSGRWIAFAGPEGLALISRDGRRTRRVLDVPGGSLDWSSRGVIAFVRQRGTRRDVYTVRPDGTDLTRITRDGASTQPTWSPDGRSLAYSRLVPAGGGELRRVDVMVRGPSQVARRLVKGGVEPVWSPDGGAIAFVRRDDIWVTGISGEGARRVYRARQPTSIGSMAWQPARRRPATTSHRS
jgi:Tol biopolymer transport system component